MTTTEQQQIDNLLAGLTREELLTLIERITQQLRQTEERKPLSPIWSLERCISGRSRYRQRFAGNSASVDRRERGVKEQ